MTTFYQRQEMARRRDERAQVRLGRLMLVICILALLHLCTGCFADSITQPRCGPTTQMADSASGKIIATVQLCR